MPSLPGRRRPLRSRQPRRRAIGRWPEVFLQTGRDLWANHALEWAAALAFYGLLSFLPLLLAAAAIAAYLVEPEWAIDWMTMLTEAVLPADVVDTERLVTLAIDNQGRVGIVGILAWLFGGRRILGALITALDLVSDVDEQRETAGRRLLVESALLLGLGGLVVLTLMVGPRLAPPGSAAASLATVLLLLGGFYVLYTVVPLGARGRGAALIGAAAATVLFLAARTLFVTFLDWIWASVDLIYGPLAIAAVLLLWGWYAGLVVLFGGSLASHVKVMRDEGGSANEARLRHVAQAREE